MGISIGEVLVSLLLYADDLVLIAPDGTSLQKMLDSLNTWAVKWRVTLNLNKTNIIHFRKIRKLDLHVPELFKYDIIRQYQMLSLSHFYTFICILIILNFF